MLRGSAIALGRVRHSRVCAYVRAMDLAGRVCATLRQRMLRSPSFQVQQVNMG